MTETLTHGAYGVSTEPMAVRLERRLPGPVERIWAYLTDSELRAQWMASGPMELKVGGRVELTWRNDDLTQGKQDRPAEFDETHTMISEVTRIDPPRLLSYTWQGDSEVTYELTPQGEEVLLVITHRRLSGRSGLLGVSSGWHAHVDLLEAKLRGEEPLPFWKNFLALRAEYDRRIP